jgi:N-carbamoyl-L-amino-acid hydrolase
MPGLGTAEQAAAAAIREDRLWQRHMAMAAIGATAHGGVCRQAFTAEDAAARRLLAGWAEARGFRSSVDDIGNMFVRRDGTDPAARPIATGSHMDTQPTGGRFDGIYGVLAGLEVLEALADAGIATRRPLELVAWANEEGGRFPPGTMGSCVFAGTLSIAAARAITDADGVSLGAALAETLAAAPQPSRGAPGFAMDGYVEAHIEQGPRLEEAGRTIGVVTGVQGARRWLVTVEGEVAHSAATPRRRRKDALLAAAAMLSALAPAMADEADTVRFTVGRFDVFPNAPGVVPGRVAFTVNLNHPDLAVLDDCTRRMQAIVAAHQGPCRARVAPVTERAPVAFDAGVMGRVRDAAAALGLGHMDLLSHAGHDAMHVAALCPTGMIFVPCGGGISHNEAETATPGDLAAGTRVLAATLVGMANAG